MGVWPQLTLPVGNSIISPYSETCSPSRGHKHPLWNSVVPWMVKKLPLNLHHTFPVTITSKWVLSNINIHHHQQQQQQQQSYESDVTWNVNLKFRSSGEPFSQPQNRLYHFMPCSFHGTVDACQNFGFYSKLWPNLSALLFEGWSSVSVAPLRALPWYESWNLTDVPVWKSGAWSRSTAEALSDAWEAHPGILGTALKGHQICSLGCW